MKVKVKVKLFFPPCTYVPDSYFKNRGIIEKFRFEVHEQTTTGKFQYNHFQCFRARGTVSFIKTNEIANEIAVNHGKRSHCSETFVLLICDSHVSSFPRGLTWNSSRKTPETRKKPRIHSPLKPPLFLKSRPGFKNLRLSTAPNRPIVQPRAQLHQQLSAEIHRRGSRSARRAAEKYRNIRDLLSRRIEGRVHRSLEIYRRCIPRLTIGMRSKPIGIFQLFPPMLSSSRSSKV